MLSVVRKARQLDAVLELWGESNVVWPILGPAVAGDLNQQLWKVSGTQ